MAEQEIVSIVFMVLMGGIFLVIFGLYIYSVIWAYADAESRGKPGCLVAILVLFFSWPLGLILWLVVRPETKDRY